MVRLARGRAGPAAFVWAVLGIGAIAPAADAHAAELLGVWTCTMYGESTEQRFFLRLAADGGIWMARVAEADDGVWRDIGTWRRSRTRLMFEDAWNGRSFRAGVDREELGGLWSSFRDRGGWWCAAMPAIPFAPADGPPPANRLLHAPVPAIMASPSYPRRAIREATEGRAVTCFVVKGTGEILRPAVVESTHEIFHEPALAAVAVSRYRSWGDEHASLPACRSFTFELRARAAGDHEAD